MTSFSTTFCRVLAFFFLADFFIVGTRNVQAALDLGFKDDSDLTSFVTRPEIKAPTFSVTIHDAGRISPGYWFVAPYAKIVQDSQARRYYQACQTGPHIYDGAGNLVWSGACQFKNQNACDFRVSRYNGSDHLSAVLYTYANDTKGHGVVMDNSFTITDSLYAPKAMGNFNMHELLVIDEGRTSLQIINKADFVDISELGLDIDEGWVVNIGFREVDIATGRTNFEWWALDHVPLSESSAEVANLDGPHPRGWNFFHMNSIDKNSDGDYMISSRYTDCIYKISGKDGSVIWRLGGTASSFVLDGFNFSKQHDARFMKQNATTEVISFLDNASDDNSETSSYSSALVVELETSVTPKIARVVRRWIRPDGQLSRLRGNFQLLPNSNAFVGWSSNCYITEHTYDGELLLEARFTSQRFVTYRAYKFNFTGNPTEPPTLTSYVFGTTPETSTTVCFVSWNGATEVAAWDFHRNSSTTSQSSLLGRASKTGFETMFQITGFEPSIYAEAISAEGQVLGRSAVETADAPPDWQYVRSIDRQDDLDGREDGFREQKPLFGLPEMHKQEL